VVRALSIYLVGSGGPGFKSQRGYFSRTYTGYIIYDFPNVWNLPNLAELILRKWRRTRFPEHAVTALYLFHLPVISHKNLGLCKKKPQCSWNIRKKKWNFLSISNILRDITFLSCTPLNRSIGLTITRHIARSLDKILSVYSQVQRLGGKHMQYRLDDYAICM
jgi:hypothetical protein